MKVEQSEVVIVDNTGTIAGKGIFNVTVNGKQSAMHLTSTAHFSPRKISKGQSQ